MAEAIKDGGQFRASGSCYGGSVIYKGRHLWDSEFPGVICSDCCGGNVELEITIEEYEKDGVSLRAVQFGKLGRNDDLYWTQWFAKVPVVGWSHFGSSTQALLSQCPPFPDELAAAA